MKRSKNFRGRINLNHNQNGPVAEALEARILYSASLAPDLPQGVVFESINTGTNYSFSTTEEFKGQITETVVTNEAAPTPVTLINFNNLSKDEVTTLLADRNDIVKSTVNLPEGENQSVYRSSNILEFSAAGEIEIENSALPIVTGTDSGAQLPSGL